MSLKNEFGQKLKSLRESLSLSQELFAEKIGIHRNSLVRIENGQGFVSSETLENIHNFLQIPYSELFSFNEQIKNNNSKAILLRLSELTENDKKFFINTIDAYIKNKK